jgi:hypothetical protein
MSMGQKMEKPFKNKDGRDKLKNREFKFAPVVKGCPKAWA